jgi:hypothetical protein
LARPALRSKAALVLAEQRLRQLVGDIDAVFVFKGDVSS